MNGRATDPVLQSVFLVVLAHSAILYLLSRLLLFLRSSAWSRSLFSNLVVVFLYSPGDHKYSYRDELKPQKLNNETLQVSRLFLAFYLVRMCNRLTRELRDRISVAMVSRVLLDSFLLLLCVASVVRSARPSVGPSQS